MSLRIYCPENDPQKMGFQLKTGIFSPNMAATAADTRIDQTVRNVHFSQAVVKINPNATFGVKSLIVF